MTRIMSWNVNGIRAAATKGFLDYLKQEQPDLLCLQETKAHPVQLSEALLNPAGYTGYWASADKKGYSGVGVYSRTRPTSVSTMGISRFDAEGRVLMLEFPHMVVISAYFPNSQDAGKRLDYKIDFCESMQSLCDRLVGEGIDVVLCGDYNVAHKPIDLEHPAANEQNAGYLPEERAWMDRFTAGGYVDGFRMFHPEPRHYTWWSYRFNARAKNVGWRIDYTCVNERLSPAVQAAEIHAPVMGSDHCPVSIVIDR